MSSVSRAVIFLVLSVVFAGFVFLMFKAFLEDVVADYLGVGLQQSIDVESLANAWIFITTTAVMLSTFLAVLLANVKRLQAIFSLFMSWITTMLILTLISYISLLSLYPDSFSGINIIQILFGFNYYNMIFTVYVLKSTDAYFFLTFVILFLQTFIYLIITKAFEEGKKPRLNPPNVRSIISQEPSTI